MDSHYELTLPSAHILSLFKINQGRNRIKYENSHRHHHRAASVHRIRRTNKWTTEKKTSHTQRHPEFRMEYEKHMHVFKICAKSVAQTHTNTSSLYTANFFNIAFRIGHTQEINVAHKWYTHFAIRLKETNVFSTRLREPDRQTSEKRRNSRQYTRVNITWIRTKVK